VEIELLRLAAGFHASSRRRMQAAHGRRRYARRRTPKPAARGAPHPTLL